MSADDGIAAAQEFIDAFNAQDHERLAAALNYPHIRLARNFTRIDNAAVEAVQVSDDKVHLLMRIDRCREPGEVYNSFDTFWIATRRDGHWGIQFRSSYLGSDR